MDWDDDILHDQYNEPTEDLVRRYTEGNVQHGWIWNYYCWLSKHARGLLLHLEQRASLSGRKGRWDDERMAENMVDYETGTKNSSGKKFRYKTHGQLFKTILYMLRSNTLRASPAVHLISKEIGAYARTHAVCSTHVCLRFECATRLSPLTCSACVSAPPEHMHAQSQTEPSDPLSCAEVA